MQNKILITVLMPCYNAQDYLPDALESIINQTYKNLEILCINDGSTDKTPEILENYAKQDRRIRLVHNESNIKLIKTLNKGIDLANGEYIARMDADDISMPQRIEIELNYLLNNPDIDIVSCSMQVIDVNGVLGKKRIIINKNTLPTFFASFLYSPIGHAPLLGKTQVFKKYKYSMENTALHTEDSELWGRMLLDGVKMNNIADVLYQVRDNPDSVSNKYTDIQVYNFVYNCKKRLDVYLNKVIPFEIVCIMVNRINADVKRPDFEMALKTLKNFKLTFIKEQAIKERVVLKEINAVYYVQLLDIMIQSYKLTKIPKRLLIILFMQNINMFIYKDVRQHFINKFK